MKDFNEMMNFSERNPLSVSSLSAAVEQNDVGILRDLIKKGRNVNIVDNRGWTPLHVAASMGRTECLKVLLKAGARIKAKTHEGETPFFVACQSNHLDIIEILVGWNDTVVCTSNNESVTPLHTACIKNNINLAKYLIERKADVNAQDSSRISPLHEAALSKNFEMCKLLTTNGAKLNSTEIDGNLPLHFACMSGNIEILRLLLNNYEGDISDMINADNCDMVTPLMLAVQSKSIDTVEELLKLGASTESRSTTSALHLAAHSGNLNVLKLLLNVTSKESIVKSCTVAKTEVRCSNTNIMPVNNSLVCLVIDSENIDCLEYILNCGLSGDVLNCPLVTKVSLESRLIRNLYISLKDMYNYASYGPHRNIIIEVDLGDLEIEDSFTDDIVWAHPMTFLLKDKMSDLEKDTVKYLKVMLQNGCMCDYSDYFRSGDSFVIHPYDGLMFSYRSNGESFKNIILECFHLMIEHGVSVDYICEENEMGSIPILFVYACRLPFFELIPYLLQQSNSTDIDDLLRWIVQKTFMRIEPLPHSIEKNLYESYKLLIKYTPKTVSNFVDEIRKPDYENRFDFIISFIHSENPTRVHSLKIMCRSVIRNTIRENCRSYPHQFKLQLNSLGLPPTLYSFLNYSDMISDICK